MYELLLGVSTLQDNPERKVSVKFDKETNALDVRSIPYIRELSSSENQVTLQVILDHRDQALLPKIIQRERKRRGMAPLTPEEMSKKVMEFSPELQVVENPGLLIEKSYDFSFVPHALGKIAYEIAFLWLGEDYLNDPTAKKMRLAITSANPHSMDELSLHVISEPSSCDIFAYWPPSSHHHLAFAFIHNGALSICIRIFDIHAAVVLVTNEVARYLPKSDAREMLRFLEIDAINGSMRNVPWDEEISRIAQTIINVAAN